MRSATVATAMQSMSKIQNATILLITADPTCGDTAFRALDFLDDETVEMLKFSGSVVVKAQEDYETILMKAFASRFVSAFAAQQRLGAEAVLFEGGRTIYQIATAGTVLTPLAA